MGMVMGRLLFLFLICFTITGCASSNILRLNPGLPSDVAFQGARIRIDGVITQDIADRVADRLDRLPGGLVTIDLDSPGGEVGAALLIHNRLNASGRPVVTRVADGERCMSSCTLFFAVGDRRLSGPQARFRFHSPRYIGWFPLPGPAVGLIEGLTRRAMTAVYADASPAFARYLVDPAVRALDTREGVTLTGAALAARGDGYVTELMAPDN
jgi:hypothetical protein